MPFTYVLFLYFPGIDHLPYQAGPVNWWSGYFTSRPALKRSCRALDAIIRAANTALILARASGAIPQVELY